MARSTPSLMALLGLVAVAGYQNREKLGQMLNDAQKPRDPNAPQESGMGGLMSDLAGMFGSGAASSGAAGGLAGGLGELLDRFRGAGHGQKADSWVSTAENEPVQPADLEQVLDDETLDELSRKTGLSRSELIQRLSTALPETVNRFTPQGRMPNSDDELRGLI